MKPYQKVLLAFFLGLVVTAIYAVTSLIYPITILVWLGAVVFLLIFFLVLAAIA